MDYIQQIQQNLSRLASQTNLQGLIEAQLKTNEESFAESITSRWRKGIDPNGADIGEYKNKAYQRLKTRLNPSAGGKVDLTLSKTMGRQLAFNEISPLRYAIGSQVKYFQYVVDSYGLKQFNITEAEKQAFMDNTWAIVTLQVLNEAYD